jgi:hypothetical protein
MADDDDAMSDVAARDDGSAISIVGFVKAIFVGRKKTYLVQKTYLKKYVFGYVFPLPPQSTSVSGNIPGC